MQKKFLSFFKTDPTSQNFFRQCNEYLKVHQEKLKKNILRPFYSRQMYTNELAETCYVVDMNLEKQVVTLLKNFCLQGNTEMQDYLRDQTFSAKSYNMVETVTDYAAEFLTHLQYPVAFDTFRRTLAALNDFIQGPNMANQEIVIQRNFIELSNAILRLGYRDDIDMRKVDMDDESLRLSHKSDMMHSDRSYKSQPYRVSGKSRFEIISEEITLPKSNFMISLIKYRCLLVLSQLLEGRSSSSYVYYILRRVIDPDVFRHNFAYQHYFMTKFHKYDYTLKMFFRYKKDVNKTKGSPLIIEVGFNLYFLLMKMQENLYRDMDEKYFKRLISLLGEKQKSVNAGTKNIITLVRDFSFDVFKLFTRICKLKVRTINKQRVENLKENDSEMEDILQFYAQYVSRIEIFKEGSFQTLYFPVLPSCNFSTETPKERFKNSVPRTNAKTKCEYFMKQSKYMITDLKLNYWLKSGLTRAYGVLHVYMGMLKKILSYIVFIINVIILFSYSNDHGDRRQDPSFFDTSGSSTEISLLVLGIIAIILIFLMFTHALINIIPLKIMRYNIQESERTKKLSKAEKLKSASRDQFFEDLKKGFKILYLL